jgi:hypothetical protein
MSVSVENLLSSFQPVTLAGMDSLKLMTRSDEKYICRIDQLPGILESARPDFQVLEHLGKRLRGYESMYLDTPDHEMYLMHHNGKLNRYKIRIREYKDSHEFFFEIKFKDNHLETAKKRIRIGPERNYLSDEIREFMSRNTTYLPEMLNPVLFSSFERMTLVNHTIRERITIDINPAWYFGDQRITLPNIVILEVKSAKTSNAAGFGYLLREARVPPRRLSKYCTGTALLFPEIKHNRFKAKLLHLRKLDKKLLYDQSFHSIN